MKEIMSTNTSLNKVPFLLASTAGRRTGWAARLALPCALAAVALMGAGCGSSSLNSAPVEDRGLSTSMINPADQVGQLPGYENAGKSGYYTIKPGDTIMRVGRETGQNWRDIVRWNNIENANLIEVGQVIRVVPPGAITQPVSSGTIITRPAVPVDPAGSASDENVNWIWPAQGTLIAGFSEIKNKGLDIAGKSGDAVMASADGKVVYAGAGLRGYGNLIILKHNSTFLTAYAHNRSLLVKEDQAVKRGQKIAEMGSTDADRVKLHFEIRRQGKPVDPARYLPAH
jgi:lipoprotein NlpD